jgi:nucleotide-binding universal stress UspA family protein
MKSKSVSKSPLPHQTISSSEVPAPENYLSSRPVSTLKQILVPIDFSECSVGALNYALMLARSFRAKLVLLHVVEPAVYPDTYLLAAATLEETNANLMAASRERLAAIRAGPSLQGLSVELLVRMGRAQSEIPDTASATGSDLIVMGTHGHSGLKDVLLGGTAERVLRHAHCPVLTVRQG